MAKASFDQENQVATTTVGRGGGNNPSLPQPPIKEVNPVFPVLKYVPQGPQILPPYVPPGNGSGAGGGHCSGNCGGHGGATSTPAVETARPYTGAPAITLSQAPAAFKWQDWRNWPWWVWLLVAIVGLLFLNLFR